MNDLPLPPPPERSFASDNAAGVSPAVMDAIVAANAGPALAYGDDPWTRDAEAAFRDLFDAPVEAHLCWGGTGANVVGLACVLQPWQAVVLAGEPWQAVKDAVAGRIAMGREGYQPEYDIYPKGLTDPWETRRFGVGEGVIGVGRGRDRVAGGHEPGRPGLPGAGGRVRPAAPVRQPHGRRGDVQRPSPGALAGRRVELRRSLFRHPGGPEHTPPTVRTGVVMKRTG